MANQMFWLCTGFSVLNYFVVKSRVSGDIFAAAAFVIVALGNVSWSLKSWF